MHESPGVIVEFQQAIKREMQRFLSGTHQQATTGTRRKTQRNIARKNIPHMDMRIPSWLWRRMC